jgi:selenocysteine lyase/cysteine desulfurase
LTLVESVRPVVPPPRGLLPVVGEDLVVPLVGGGEARHANLDVAATAPALVAVAERVAQVLPWSGSVHRGAGLPARACTALYEQARAGVGRFVGVRPDDLVVVTRNTTDALTLLSRCVPQDAGDVVVLDLEHHANLLPWRRRAHRLVPVAATLADTLGRLEAALAAAPAALVAVTGASNVTGDLLPVPAIARLARAHGARVAVDAAQLAPHRRFTLAALGADYVALSGHKLYAPYGAGALVGRRDWLDAAEPYLPGGGAVRDVRADGTTWAHGPARHEGGTPNLLGAVALAEACAALDDLPAGALERHEAALRERLLDGLAGLDGVRVHRLWPDAGGAIGVVAFTVAGYAPGHVAAVLSAEHGVGVRNGRFCAHQLLGRLGLPGGAVRASVGVATGAGDVDRLLAALGALVAEGPRWAYEAQDGAWAPVPDDRRLPAGLLGRPATGPAAGPCAQ